jgi:hypothetical protein
MYVKVCSILRTGAQFCPWTSIETRPPCWIQIEFYIPKVEHQHEGSQSNTVLSRKYIGPLAIRARTVFLAARKLWTNWTLDLLAFNEKSTFDLFALFGWINWGSPYPPK